MSRSRPHRSEPFYRAALISGTTLFRFWRLRPIETGLENVPDIGGAVIAMTHFGYLEFALIEWAAWRHNRRRIRFLAKKSVFDKPGVGWVMRGMRHIAVDMTDGNGAYSTAVTALRNGEVVGVFPEAGVSASFTVREFKTGAVRLAQEAGVPIIPAAAWGGQRLLTKNHRIGFGERFGVPISVSFGTPITVSVAENPREATQKLRVVMQSMVDDLQRHYPVDGTGKWWQPATLGGTAPTPEEATAADVIRNLRRASRRADAVATVTIAEATARRHKGSP